MTLGAAYFPIDEYHDRWARMYRRMTEAGMVIGSAAFFARTSVGGAGFEQNLIVTDRGTELVTTSPMLWF